jgi:hypothetical protein
VQIYERINQAASDASPTIVLVASSGMLFKDLLIVAKMEDWADINIVASRRKGRAIGHGNF